MARVKRSPRKKKPWELARAMEPLRQTWIETVSAPRGRLITAIAVLGFVSAMLLARIGTVRARSGAAFVLAGLVLAGVGWIWRERRVLARPKSAIAYLVGRIDPLLAAKALRALSLLDDSGEVRDPSTSPVLARLHVSRVLASLPADRVTEGAIRTARFMGRATIGIALAAVAVFATNPWGVFEGADVLCARRNVAPLGMVWLADSLIKARPPDYLHEDERSYGHPEKLALPRGTLLTFHGVPAHNGRRLALSDGTNEVPFVDDGAGGVVARWPLAESVTLRIVARFGDVVIPEPDSLELTSIPDEAPIVTLEGAPRQIQLSTEDVSEIPIRYEATDDHGLREVHLVLRAGTREERRVLARLDGETRRDSGGHMLRASDVFIKRSHVPVEVRVEAKDNDPITGPKWGASPPITLVPPDVGEPEALRIEALRQLRDTLVDSLSWRIDNKVPATGLKAFLDDEKRGVVADESAVESTLSATYAGVRVPGRLVAMVRGQMRKVREAMDVETRGASTASHEKLVVSSEKIVLVVDGVIRGLGLKDTQTSARQLADVADDLALGLQQMQTGEDATHGKARADAATQVLGGGRKQLAKLGVLGRDLGEIIEADLLRVARAKGDIDLPHAEIAARDLAARLHQPDPSFGSKGQFGHGGGESGGGRGTPGADEGEGGEGERAFEEAAQDLERLAQDHAAEIGKVEQALKANEALEDTAEEKEHAKAVREATKGLPTVGAGSDSWTSKGAASRELSEQMARALENGNVSDAVQSGRAALQSIDEAKRIASRERWHHDDDAQKRLDDAKKKLDPEVKWAEKKLEELRKKAAQKAAPELNKDGDEENDLAERAGKLADKARDRGSLPSGALSPLEGAQQSARDAAKALKRGDADKALEHQREAQRQLEAAKDALGREQDDGDQGSSGSESGDSQKANNQHADIPKADAHKGPEEFRRRVIKGLAQPGPARNKDAVERYAEGLLR